MYVILEKGVIPLAAEIKSDLHIVSTTSSFTPKLREDATILLSWRGDPPTCQVSFHLAGSSSPLKTRPAQKFPGVFVDTPIGYKIPHLHTSALRYDIPPFWKGLRFDAPTLSLPVMGMLNDQWLDGWMVHMSESGRVFSLIPPGCAARCSINLDAKQDEGLKWEEAIASFPPMEEFQRQSLVTMILSHYKSEDLQNIKLKTFNLVEAVALLLLRQAFPFAPMKVHHPDETRIWPARFKNFLDSIQADWKKGEGGNFVSTFFGHLREDDLLKLVPVLDEDTRILAGIKL